MILEWKSWRLSMRLKWSKVVSTSVVQRQNEVKKALLIYHIVKFVQIGEMHDIFIFDINEQTGIFKFFGIIELEFIVYTIELALVCTQKPTNEALKKWKTFNRILIRQYSDFGTRTEYFTYGKRNQESVTFACICIHTIKVKRSRSSTKHSTHFILDFLKYISFASLNKLKAFKMKNEQRTRRRRRR